MNNNFQESQYRDKDEGSRKVVDIDDLNDDKVMQGDHSDGVIGPYVEQNSFKIN